MSRKIPIEAKAIVKPLLISSCLSLSLYAARILASGSDRYWFLVWNLALAWAPLLLSYWLWLRLKTTAWLSWSNLFLTMLWLLFLPNSFYIISDFIHIHNSGEVSLLFDAVMFTSFVWNGVMLGLISVFMLHREFLKRFSRRITLGVLGSVFLLSSFAIYLGRYLAWNTWDVVVNPAGILFDISDRILSPASYPNTFTTTLMFFVSISTMYYVVYQLINLAKKHG